MESLDWDAFERLPGEPDGNFERLCRAVIRRNFGRFGDFSARANQAGVEFHLKLHTACSLGQPGDWVGWQCRWYGLGQGEQIGTARRRKIAEAVETTHRHLPGLTHWFLWTRRPLTPTDEAWFQALPTHMRLGRLTATEVEEYLSGEAAVLRATYFGELVLTPVALAELHARAVAPIRDRWWVPEVHQIVPAEQRLRQMLGQPEGWPELSQTAARLAAEADAVDAGGQGIGSDLREPLTALVASTRSTAESLAEVAGHLDRLDLDGLARLLAASPGAPDLAVRSLPRQLRAVRHPASMPAANALDALRTARRLLGELGDETATRLVAVTADAGCGKSELAAHLTAPAGRNPAGVLLHGRDLRAGGTLDQLAGRVVVHGSPVRSMEALVAALDAAGQRAGQRLPLIIDGLNEAEDPRDWKPELASLAQALRPYPYVLVVCTLRPPFAAEALPESICQVPMPGFAGVTAEAVGRYFAHYRIDPADADLPFDLLEHPLTLRLFCEVTNRDRSRTVGVEAMPGSLTVLFDRYLGQVADRVAELAPRQHRYHAQDVLAAFGQIGAALWEGRDRSLGLGDLRRRLADAARPWDASLVRALEHEGVLLSSPDPGDGPRSGKRLGVAFDRLAGHLIAESLIEQHGASGLAALLRQPETVTALSRGPGGHTLAEDILYGLVGLVPLRLRGQQVWRMVAEPLQAAALEQAAMLDGRSLDAATVDRLAALAAEPVGWGHGLFHRLYQTRGAVAHPLDAEFLDRVLRPMPVAQRDPHWTEWVRRNEDGLSADLGRLEARWRSDRPPAPADRLRARWVMWLLTSTVRPLRDRATRALYWFGRRDPAGLFALALDSLAVNDPSVPERVLAAAHGVAMAHQFPDPEFADHLGPYLAGVRDRLLGPTATHPTSHWLVWRHAQGAWDIARRFHPAAVPGGVPDATPLPFAPGPAVTPIPPEDRRAGVIDLTLRMDFKNYTIGRLIRKRRNYDMDHPDHRAAMGHVRGVVWQLGWRDRPFTALDNSIAHEERYRRAGKTDRYGKKYGWVGFYTHAGELADAGELPDDKRLSDLGIDPSFPEPPRPASDTGLTWLDSNQPDDLRWLCSEPTLVPDALLHRDEAGSAAGPWVAAYAWLECEDRVRGRRVYGRVQAFLVDDGDVDRLVGAFNARQYPGGFWLPDLPKDYYTFAGEVPWSDQFGRAAGADTDGQPYLADVELDDESDIPVEVLAHEFAWEDHHSTLNTAGGALVASRAFSAAFDLRGVPQTFDQQTPDGGWAARSFAAPAGYTGNVLYLRTDLIRAYAAGRRLVWLMWGERLLDRVAYDTDDRLQQAHASGDNDWRAVRRLDDV